MSRINYDKEEKSEVETNNEKPTCGLIMPISKIDDLDETHWKKVLSILEETLKENFTVSMVSESEDSGVIHGKIVTNIYENDIVVCDVSCRNPNVMFELGMRLAFDKPTILIMDDQTDYIFDTTPIEHIKYPRDLNYTDVVNFTKKLLPKVNTTFAKFKTNGNKSFLDHFSSVTITGLKSSEVDVDHFLLDSIKDLTSEVSMLKTYFKHNEDMITSPEKAEYALLETVIAHYIKMHNIDTIDLEKVEVITRLCHYVDEQMRTLSTLRAPNGQILQMATKIAPTY